MDVLLYNSGHYHVQLQVVDNGSSSINQQAFCSISSCTYRPSTSFSGKHLWLKNAYQLETSLPSSQTIQRLHVTPRRVFNESYGGPVVVEGQGLEDISESDTESSIPKVMIPGLPDESGASISGSYWEWKPKISVYYEKAGCENVKSPPILFLPGFGVGSFHYKKQLKDLGRDFRVYALDFLGQGKSLPTEDPAPLANEFNSSGSKDQTWGFGDKTEPWAEKLVYSIDLWREQVHYFIEEVIGEPAYIVGNSLGGYVATYFAACNPGLVMGVTLLNATPFWGFLPNSSKSPLLAKLFPWAGTFPLPSYVRKVTERVWQKVSDPETVANLLRQVYADHTTDVDEVVSQITETTQHPAAAAAFASIMCAPTGSLSFNESLSRCRESKVSMCLMYGKEDPWVKPLWGQQVKRELPEAPYYEISPAGHCPHDEVPEVVNYLLRGWIRNLESKGSDALPLLDDTEAAQSNLAKDVEFIRGGSKKLVRVRFFGSQFSLWNIIRARIRGRLPNLGMSPRQ